MNYRLKARGSRYFGPNAKKRQALEAQIKFEVEDAKQVVNQGLISQIKWLWLARFGYRSFFRGVWLLLRMRIGGTK